MEVTKEAIGWNQLFFKAFKLQRIPHQLKVLDNPQQQLILLDLSRNILVRRVHSQFTWRRVVQLFGACYCCNELRTSIFSLFCLSRRLIIADLCMIAFPQVAAAASNWPRCCCRAASWLRLSVVTCLSCASQQDSAPAGASPARWS